MVEFFTRIAPPLTVLSIVMLYFVAMTSHNSTAHSAPAPHVLAKDGDTILCPATTKAGIIQCISGKVYYIVDPADIHVVYHAALYVYFNRKTGFVLNIKLDSALD